MTDARRVNRPSAFTLVEILVVIGIIGVILSIALPTTFAMRRKANRIKISHDIEALATGLQEYKNVHNDFPRVGTSATAPGIGGTIPGMGVEALYCGLTGLTITGAIDTEAKSGRPKQPFINVEKFKVTINTSTGRGEIRDTYNLPFLYFAGAVSIPDIKNTVSALYIRNNGSNTIAPFPLYNSDDCPLLPLISMRKLMGDDNPVNGRIDAAETPAYTGPFVIWSAGADSAWGLDPTNKSDDIANFPFPGQYNR